MINSQSATGNTHKETSKIAPSNSVSVSKRMTKTNSTLRIVNKIHQGLRHSRLSWKPCSQISIRANWHSQSCGIRSSMMPLTLSSISEQACNNWSPQTSEISGRTTPPNNNGTILHRLAGGTERLPIPHMALYGITQQPAESWKTGS